MYTSSLRSKHSWTLIHNSISRKSYDYKVEAAAAKSEDATGPKYSFDYTLQEPLILHPEHTDRDYSLRVEAPPG